MSAPDRHEKVVRVLKKHVGEWMSARELLVELVKEFNGRVPFSSARSLALYLKRFCFVRRNKKYLIDLEKIKIREQKTREWKEVFKRR